jgi:hypothetical protein
VNIQTYVLICRYYIVASFIILVSWNYFAYFYTNGKVSIPKQCGKWCKKYLILILIIGFILGHWFSQMRY